MQDDDDAATLSPTITVTPGNVPPTDIVLGHSSVDENSPGAIIGDVTVVEPNAGQTHTFETSDGRFEILGGKLKLKKGISLDFEAATTISLDVTATDSGTPPLSLTHSFVINVNNVNDPPAAIALSGNNVKECVSGLTVGSLTAVDQDAGQTHVFAVADSDSDFEIVDRTLKLKEDKYLSLASGETIDIQVTVTDSGTPTGSGTWTLSINVLANPRPWQNGASALDVNADGHVVPIDALSIINELNSPKVRDNTGRLPSARPHTWPYYYDTNGDGFCTAAPTPWVSSTI